ncbi:hypothetical protein [Pelagibaculum spongiae]|uniref:SnoaL-like domain-containing protein n=1 Tax=Pelagibaculum spongiae TaxID=2080658 RepID=A0A2V1H0U9_9GAMM|nr:hypothetical protein [Pelagibaculum spongiae]PVZ72103.1 hypothetical protein DC094_03550 [Pelagibaculum spongiae]
MNSEKQQVEQFIVDYYQKFDQRAPLKEFDQLIDWDDFQLLTGQVIIKSRDEYRDWYLEVRHEYENSQHILKNLQIELLDIGCFYARADLKFKAIKKGFIDKKIKTKAKLEWTIKSDDSGFKIKEYIVK